MGGSETAAVVGRSKQYFPGFSASACVSAGVVTLRHCVPGKLQYDETRDWSLGEEYYNILVTVVPTLFSC